MGRGQEEEERGLSRGKNKSDSPNKFNSKARRRMTKDDIMIEI